jgi:hypothetical protein
MSLKKGRDEDDLSNMVGGVLFQLARKLQVLIQKKQSIKAPSGWRPSFVAVSSNSATRLAPFDLLRWISHHHGFGTFIHFIKGQLNEETNEESKKKLIQLIQQSRETNAGIYVDTIVSPSFKTAVAQIVQIPGISGMENNSILFEYHEDDREDINDIVDGCKFAAYVNFNTCVLRSSERHFGYRKNIHIWLTPGDYRNANLMIFLAYIILGHKEWRASEIELCVAFDEKEMEKEVAELYDQIDKGRIPFSKKNITKIPWDKNSVPYESLVTNHSEDVDLVIMGFSLKKIIQENGEFFKKFNNIKDLLFVRAGQEIVTKEY